MSKRVYELYIYDNETLDSCVGKFLTIKSVDEYIQSHNEHKYLMMNKPITKKIKYNCLGGKEIY